RSRRTGLVVIATLVVLGLLFGSNLTDFYVDWLWFGEIGRAKVFWTLAGTRLLLGLGFGLSLAALLLLNVMLARASTPRTIPRADSPQWRRTAAFIAREGVSAAFVLGAIILGFIGGAIAAARWD